jgi:hypothetical protein
MKIILISLSIIVGSFYANAQEPIDTLDIVTSYIGSKHSKIYHIKNKNHSNMYKGIPYPPIDEVDRIKLSSEGNTKINDAIVRSLSKERMVELSGRKISFSVAINGKGYVKSVMVIVPQNDNNDFVLSKEECKNLIKNIKKDVIFDVEENFTTWKREVTIIISRRFD